MESQCAGVDSSLISVLFFSDWISEFLILVLNVVTRYARKAHLATTDIIDCHFVSISPNRNMKFRFRLQLLLKIPLKSCLIRFDIWRDRNLKVKDLINILFFEFSSPLEYSGPLDIDPNLSLTTIVEISEHICFIDFDA